METPAEVGDPDRSLTVAAQKLSWNQRAVSWLHAASTAGLGLKDPAHLFNSSLDGIVRRAIDIHEGEEVDESAFQALVRQAAALNSSGESKLSKKAKS